MRYATTPPQRSLLSACANVKFLQTCRTATAVSKITKDWRVPRSAAGRSPPKVATRPWLALKAVVRAVLVLLVQGVSWAQPSVTTEYQLKAAFLFNFLQFVDWPANAFNSAEQPVAMCLLGPDPFGADLDALIAGERIDGRPIEVRRLQSVDAASACQLVFLNLRSPQALRAAIERLKGLPVLTVSDVTTFSGQGGMIEFVMREDRVRLRVNLRAASEAQLRLSSKLLRRSEIVEPASA